MKTYKYKKQVRVGYDADGRSIRKWIYSDSKDGLVLQKQKLIEQYSAPQHGTFLEYADKWFLTYKAHCEPATKSWIGRTINQCESIHHMPLTEITNMDLQRIINEYKDKPDSAKKIALTLNQIFTRLQKDGAIQRNPAADLILPKKAKVVRRSLLPEEVDAVKELLQGDTLSPQEKMFLAMLYYFGLRPEEARALTVDDIDMENWTLTVNKALSYTQNQGDLKGTKTDNSRVLPIPKAVRPQIREYLNEMEHSLLFTNERGNAHSMTSYRHLWEHHIKRAIESIAHTEGLVPYCFRRNYATRLYYSGISLKKAAYLMGHADTKMILNIYASIEDERENLDAIVNME